MFNWLSSNGKIIFINRSIRAFSLGFLSIALGIYLQEIGTNAFFIGIILSASILGAAFFTLLTGHFAPVFGIKKMFLTSLCISLIGITIFLFTNNIIFLTLSSILAFISPSGRELGPLLSLEQAYLPTTVDYKYRTKAFSYLNIVDDLSGSIGNLLVAIPFFLQASFHFEKIISYKALFFFYILLNIFVFFFYTKLSDVHIKYPRIQLSADSKKRVVKMALLFSIDSFGGGMVLDSITSLWFHAKFNTPLSIIGILFFAAGLLETISFYVSGKLGERIGLINTMVFTHIPSSICLILMPFMPTVYLAGLFYLLRQLLSEMDIPVRQSYVVSVVRPEERTQTTSITNVSRTIISAISPPIASKLLLLPFVSPFVLGGVLKIIYDISLYINFKHIKPLKN